MSSNEDYRKKDKFLERLEMFVADTAYINGQIWTMRKEGEKVSAIVVYDEKIIFAGETDEAKKYAVKETVDLGGKHVLPGFTDTHLHLLLNCISQERVDLAEATSIEEIVSKMKAESDPDAEWILGDNVHIERLADGRFPERLELDQISVDKPVMLYSYCQHAQMGNSLAMKRGGIEVGTVPANEGEIEFYEDGTPNGVIRETTYANYLSDIIEAASKDAGYRKKLLRKYLPYYNSQGLTSLQTFSALSNDPLEYIDEYFELDREGSLSMRIVLNASVDVPNNLRTVSGFGNNRIKLGAKKIFCDGSLSSRSAALFEPYADAPDEYGILVVDQDEMTREVKNAYKSGMDLAVHSIGDRSMEIVLNAIEATLEEAGYEHPSVSFSGSLEDAPDGFASAAEEIYSKSDRRFRIIHDMLVTPEQIERIRKLPVVLDVQPIFIRNWVRIAEDRLGPERVKHLMPFKTYIESGLLVTGGTDAPVESTDPLIGIQCAVTRADLTGYPKEGFLPEQALSVFEAVSLFTRNAAYCTSEENIKGTLEYGKLADFIVLSENIFEISPDKIAEIEIEKTYIGGQEVYSK
ncbi:MAG: amidohydrolase [Clostridiales Family XIII bacterium]|nr:amidohydrolase [Clostridiales Family XIII bacterium]